MDEDHFSVEDFVTERLVRWYLERAREVFREEEERFINGPGVGKPLGILVNDRR